MKKMIFAICMAVIIGFTMAVGLCVRELVSPLAVSNFENGMRIVLDAGHGGMDGGVVGKKTRVKESDLNLSITYKLKAELEDAGFTVTLTRKTDAGLYDAATKGFKRRDMQKRREIIQSVKPALVISIHQNFYPSQTTRGAQVFYSKNSEGGRTLAFGMQSKLNTLYAEENVRARNAASGDFYILECVESPSIIIECGFLSSEKDERLLCDEAWQKKLAQSITSGILSYFSDSSA